MRNRKTHQKNMSPPSNQTICTLLKLLVLLRIKDVISQKLNKGMTYEYRATQSFSNTSDAIVLASVCVTHSSKSHNLQAYLSKPQFSIFYNTRSTDK